MRCVLMSVAPRARCVFDATPSYLPRVEKWSHGKCNAKKTCRFCFLFDCKKGAFEVGAVEHRFSRAVRAVPWAPWEPRGALQNGARNAPQVDGAAVFASRRGPGVPRTRAVRRLLWRARLRVH